MTEVNFTHAQFNTEVTVVAELVFAVTFAPTLAATVVIATGGAAVPVKESTEQVKQAIAKALTKENN